MDKLIALTRHPRFRKASEVATMVQIPLFGAMAAWLVLRILVGKWASR